MSDRIAVQTPTGNKPADYYEGVNLLLFNMVPLEASRILEIGCANGRLGQAIKNRNSRCHYIGIELFENAGTQARMVLDKVFIADVEKFEWANLSGEKFDCIIFADVLEHLKNPEETIRSVTTLLSPNGCLLCCLPNVSHWSVINGLLKGEWEYSDSGVLDRTHLRFYTLQTFQTLLQECGFHVVKYAKYFTNLVVDESIIPLLNALQIDTDAFMERANTIQFLVKAEKVLVDYKQVDPSIRPQKQVLAAPDLTTTIVVCVNDERPLTDEFLDSLAKARPLLFFSKLLVADDASNENISADLFLKSQKYDWLHIVRFESPVGVLRSRNWTAGNTDTDVLIFLDGNCTLDPDWLVQMLATMQDTRVGMVGSQLRFPDGLVSQAGIVFMENDLPEYLFRGSSPDKPNVNLTLEVPAVSGSCLLIKRNVFLEVQGFSTALPVFYSDLDLCFKVRRMGLSVVYQPNSKVVHPETGNGSFSRLAESQDSIQRTVFFEKWQEFIHQEKALDPQFYACGRRFLTSKTLK